MPAESGAEDMDNRDKILTHAQTLFALRGYDAVGVQEIAHAAGVTKPTLYHYFGSKRGLLDAALDAHFSELLRQAGDAARYEGDLPLNLYRVAGVYLKHAQRHPPFYRMQLAMWFAPRDSDAFGAIRAYRERQHRLLEEMFVAAAGDHGNMRGRHRPYAATFLGMIHTFIGLWLNGYAELNDELVYRAVHQFMHGIFS